MPSSLPPTSADVFAPASPHFSAILSKAINSEEAAAAAAAAASADPRNELRCRGSSSSGQHYHLHNTSSSRHGSTSSSQQHSMHGNMHLSHIHSSHQQQLTGNGSRPAIISHNSQIDGGGVLWEEHHNNCVKVCFRFHPICLLTNIVLQNNE